LSRSNFCTFKSTPVQKMKSDTAKELSRIYNAAISAVNGQDSIGKSINSHDFDLFNHFIIEFFDSKTRFEWETHTSVSTDLPDYDTFMDFVKRTLTFKAKLKIIKISGDSPRNCTLPSALSTSLATSVLCKGKHNVMMCEFFKVKSAINWKVITEIHRCASIISVPIRSQSVNPSRRASLARQTSFASAWSISHSKICQNEHAVRFATGWRQQSNSICYGDPHPSEHWAIKDLRFHWSLNIRIMLVSVKTGGLNLRNRRFSFGLQSWEGDI